MVGPVSPEDPMVPTLGDCPSTHCAGRESSDQCSCGNCMIFHWLSLFRQIGTHILMFFLWFYFLLSDVMKIPWYFSTFSVFFSLARWLFLFYFRFKVVLIQFINVRKGLEDTYLWTEHLLCKHEDLSMAPQYPCKKLGV